MSDEESFVILGSCSPRNSLEINESPRSGFQSLENSKIEKDSVDTSTNDKKAENEVAQKSDDQLNNITPTNSVNMKLLEAQKEELVSDNSQNVTNKSLERSIEKNQSVSIQNGSPLNRSIVSGGSANGSLASSFIMGEINADVLKSSVYSQFPSICSMEACAEDVVKLQNFMSEYLELKSTLAKVNATMRMFYDRTQQWRDEIQQYKQQLQGCQTQIAILRNENLELKNDMNTRMEQMKISDEMKKKDTAKLVQLVSEKAALVDNLRAQIEHLESQNLASFEYVSKNGKDGKQNSDYIARSEHLLALKEQERKMDALLAENYELKDMQKVYVEEINCLKVNLTAAEELLQQSRRDIDLLKASDLEKSMRFTEYETERNKMREEILLLRQQVDVYGKDFQMERSARENLAGEKDQLIQDLRAMQRANQELIEQQKRSLYNAMQPNTSTNTTSTGSQSDSSNISSSSAANQPLPQPSPSNSVNHFNCPVCQGRFKSLAILQSHVNSCLDNS